MRTLSLSITLCVFMSLAAGAAAQDAEAQLKSLGFLAGSWSGEWDGNTFRAYYSTPEGGKILSSSEMLAGGQVVYHEFERFDVAGGAVHMTPYPGGTPVTGFTLARVDSETKTVVFENPKKDFPTRITYHVTEEDHLVITLSDPVNAPGQKQVIDMVRVE